MSANPNSAGAASTAGPIVARRFARLRQLYSWRLVAVRGIVGWVWYKEWKDIQDVDVLAENWHVDEAD